jgi:ribose transport system substrate-binding protein
MVVAPLLRIPRALVAALALLAPSCQRDAAASGSAKSPLPARYVAVVPKGTSHEFWVAVHAGAVKAAKEGGVVVDWKGPPREDDRQQQISVVENFITMKVAGIVLAPLDAHALTGVCKEAARAGIPVVVIDSGLDWDGMVSFVATDNRHGGALAADRLGALLAGKGRVLMMRYQEGSASTMEREAGFLDEMKAKYPAIELVSTDQHAGATIDTAQKTAENLLQRHAELDGVFTPNESTTVGMLRALDDAGRAKRTKFVGFDASKKLVEGLTAGKIHGLVVQNPFRMGELGVKALLDHLDGKPVEKRIDTGCLVATAENLADPAVKALLPPDPAK